MRKPITLLLILGLALILGANSAQAIRLDFSPLSQEVMLGSPVVVEVIISDLGNEGAPSLGTFDLDVLFNTAILSFSQVLFGDPMLGDQLDLSDSGDTVYDSDSKSLGSINLYGLSFEYASNLDLYQASSFVLASLTFEAIGEGLSLLDFFFNESQYLGDSEGNNLTVEALGGSVNVVAPVPEPATILLLAAGMGGLGLVRRRRLTARRAKGCA